MVQTIFNNYTGSPDAPQAYLVYLTFDEGFNLNESPSGIALIAHAKCSRWGSLTAKQNHQKENSFAHHKRGRLMVALKHAWRQAGVSKIY